MTAKKPGAVKGRPPGSGKGAGRKKGSVNKWTGLARDAIAMVAEGLGGPDRMIAWAKENPANERIFWGTIYPKMMPLQIANPGGEEFKTVSRIERVIIDSPAH